ncbi:MAG TPA: hypothetical protein VN721_17450 [Flavipsychrobacter sp.]|nr:hypothetical protein [Flavipsychrobacter sp.]
MKPANYVLPILILAFSFSYANAQETTNGPEQKDTSKKYHYVFSVGKNGVKYETPNSQKRSKNKTRFETHWVMMDLGFNLLTDNTNYNSPAAGTFLHVPDNAKNSDLLGLRRGKSINVNIYPLMLRFAALKTKRQSIYISTGLGLQLYNFRYNEPVVFTKSPNSFITTNDTLHFRKDKLAFDYLNVPLMLTFKTKLGGLNKWLVYGVGITGGYRISSWTKQTSSELGKVKTYDQFNFQNFNSCLTGEIGIDDGIRFYVSYQLTSLYQNTIDQHPISFGIRFLGI